MDTPKIYIIASDSLIHMRTCMFVILYTYKFSRHVNFKDVTNPAFSQFYFLRITKYPALQLMQAKVLPMKFRGRKFRG